MSLRLKKENHIFTPLPMGWQIHRWLGFANPSRDVNVYFFSGLFIFTT